MLVVVGFPWPGELIRVVHCWGCVRSQRRRSRLAPRAAAKALARCRSRPVCLARRAHEKRAPQVSGLEVSELEAAALYSSKQVGGRWAGQGRARCSGRPVGLACGPVRYLLASPSNCCSCQLHSPSSARPPPTHLWAQTAEANVGQTGRALLQEAAVREEGGGEEDEGGEVHPLWGQREDRQIQVGADRWGGWEA